MYGYVRLVPLLFLASEESLFIFFFFTFPDQLFVMDGSELVPNFTSSFQKEKLGNKPDRFAKQKEVNW